MKLLIALALTIIVIQAVSLYPFKLHESPDSIGPVVVLSESWGRAPPSRDFLANIVFYVPIGLLATLAWARLRTRQLPQTVLLAAMALSASNELMQHYIGRQVSAFDIIANTFGALLGVIVAMLWMRERGPPG